MKQELNQVKYDINTEIESIAKEGLTLSEKIATTWLFHILGIPNIEEYTPLLRAKAIRLIGRLITFLAGMDRQTKEVLTAYENPINPKCSIFKE